MSRARGVCALVLIDDGAATTRDADVPEEIILQRLRASSEDDDGASDDDGDDDDGVPGILSPPSARDVVVIGRQKGVVDHAMDCASIPLLLSRKHAAMTCDGAAHYVRDLATTNGTFVNGSRIDAKVDVALKDGDVVAFGGPRSWRGIAVGWRTRFGIGTCGWSARGWTRGANGCERAKRTTRRERRSGRRGRS